MSSQFNPRIHIVQIHKNLHSCSSDPLWGWSVTYRIRRIHATAGMGEWERITHRGASERAVSSPDLIFVDALDLDRYHEHEDTRKDQPEEIKTDNERAVGRGGAGLGSSHDWVSHGLGNGERVKTCGVDLPLGGFECTYAIPNQSSSWSKVYHSQYIILVDRPISGRKIAGLMVPSGILTQSIGESIGVLGFNFNTKQSQRVIKRRIKPVTYVIISLRTSKLDTPTAKAYSGSVHRSLTKLSLLLLLNGTRKTIEV
ncbi:hypothetical protein B0H13DRAFT_1890290 [Mycena leptocephala]|nr:hypothetical protein B0H13DRAFT_1890290 [Mycena leptocephala]